jgi:hypothetical protein
VEFRILGPLEVARDGAPLALGAVQQRALLAVLVLHCGEVVSTDRLVFSASPYDIVHPLLSCLRRSSGPAMMRRRPPAPPN